MIPFNFKNSLQQLCSFSFANYLYILLYPSLMIKNIYHLISVRGVWRAKTPTAYIDTKNILHLVSYISAGVPGLGK